MPRRNRRTPSSKQVASFWFVVVVVALILGLGAFLAGKLWVGGMIKRGKIDQGAPKIIVQTPNGAVEQPGTGPEVGPPPEAKVRVDQRAASESERSELEQRFPQDAAQLNRFDPGASRPDESVGSDQKPLSEPRGSGRGSEPTPAGGTGIYSVTAGSYADARNAEREVARLISKGYSPYLVKISRGGKTMHRVTVGSFADRKEAEQLSEKLRRDGANASVASE
jgi:DedD protein